MIKVAISLFLLGWIVMMLCSAPSHAQLYGYTRQNSAGMNANYTNAPDNVLFILDASDSMNDRLDGQSKFQAAKDTVLRTIRSMPPNVNVGLRVYGHRLGNSGFTMQGPLGLFVDSGTMCRQSQLLVPLGTNNRATIAAQMMNIQAVGKTPITYSLQQAVDNDFAGYPGKKTIILVSDGEETCWFNPCDYAVDMVRSGIQVKINTIGFVTHNRRADQQLKCVALATKGKFYSADTAADLAKGLQDSAQVQTSVEAKIFPGK